MKLIQEILDLEDEFIALRHHIHKYPELSLQEFDTSKLIASKLESYGYKVEYIAGTGLVGQLKKGDGNKKLGLRADMDALPINEETKLEYKSVINNKMHACGHDGHSATMLLLAKYASNLEFNGTLNVIFQMAEECGCGAKKMVEAGLFERFPCDYIFAYHNIPNLPENKKIFIKSGCVMASSDEIYVKIKGKGGHGSAPHLSNDPTICIAQIINSLQTIVSRFSDPQECVVLSVGGIICGHLDSYNVIQDEGQMYLNMRSLNNNVRTNAMQKLQDLIENITKMNDCSYEFRINDSVKLVENDPTATHLALECANEIFGKDLVESDFKSIMASEDFSEMLEVVKGAYVFINNGNTPYLHNSKYNFNDEILCQGASFFAKIISSYLK